MRKSLQVAMSLLMIMGTSAASASVEWPLPVPQNIIIEDMADFHGVLYRLNERAIQIDWVEWIIKDSELSMRAVGGYYEDGAYFSYTRTIPPFEPYSIVADLEGFTSFRLNNGLNPLYVQSIVWGTTDQGFLRVVQSSGVKNITLESFATTSQTGPCSAVTHQTCLNRNCIDAFPCGSAPTCPCKLGGGCDPVTYTYCEGPPCPANEKCNNDTSHCACVPLVPDPPTPPEPPQPPTPIPPVPPQPPVALERCPRDFSIDPVTGICGPDICYLCYY